MVIVLSNVRFWGQNGHHLDMRCPSLRGGNEATGFHRKKERACVGTDDTDPPKLNLTLDQTRMIATISRVRGSMIRISSPTST